MVAELTTRSSQREKLACEKGLKARMLFSIFFIYNSKDTKGAILQSSHTEYPSEVSRTTGIYRNKPCKQGQKKKNNKPKNGGEKWDIRKTSVMTVILKG